MQHKHRWYTFVLQDITHDGERACAARSSLARTASSFLSSCSIVARAILFSRARPTSISSGPSLPTAQTHKSLHCHGQHRAFSARAAPWQAHHTWHAVALDQSPLALLGQLHKLTDQILAIFFARDNNTKESALKMDQLRVGSPTQPCGERILLTSSCSATVTQGRCFLRAQTHRRASNFLPLRISRYTAIVQRLHNIFELPLLM